MSLSAFACDGEKFVHFPPHSEADVQMYNIHTRTF